MQIDKTSPITKSALSLMISAVLLSALSAGLHSHLHPLSKGIWILSTALGLLALLKLANSIADRAISPIARLVHWIHAMTFEVFAFLGVALMRILRLAPTRGPSSGRPILLIHGYCNDSSVWAYISRRLAEQNLGPIYAIDLGHPFRSLSDYADKVAEKTAEIRRETGRNDLVLVGHSMGGLVATIEALRDPNIAAVITVGTPLAGTHTARIGVGPNAKEMRRSSPFLAELSQKLSAEIKIPFYHIATKTDQLIIPSHSALRGGAPEREFLFEDLGHASLLFSPRVAALLSEWLKN